MLNFDDNKIDDYLLNRLTEKEHAEFTTALQADENLQQRVAEQRDYLMGMELFAEHQFTQQLQTVDTELQQAGFFLSETDIDNYLTAQVDKDTEQLIEQRMATDDKFAATVAQQQDLIQGIENFAEQDFLQQLTATDNELATEGFFQKKTTTTTQEAKVVRMGRRRILAIAASISGLLIAVWAVLQFAFAPDPLDNNFVAYEDQLTPFLSETGFVRPDYLDELTQGMVDYNTNNYVAAQRAFQQYLAQAPADDQFYPFAQFYLAQTYLTDEQANLAIPLLEQLRERTDFQWAEEVNWYLAISYLASNNKAAAQPLLQQLLNSKKYGTRAQDLL